MEEKNMSSSASSFLDVNSNDTDRRYDANTSSISNTTANVLDSRVKRLAPAVALVVVGAASFAFAFRQSVKKARALNRDLIEAAKAAGEIQEDPADLARKALGYATALVAAFGFTSIAATAAIMDVRSVPEFAEKMRYKVRGFTLSAQTFVQSVTDRYITKKGVTEEERELLAQFGIENRSQNNASSSSA
eukprot:m.186078 g.186078  ORF g.186078 m.186078 type:complete len:190 (+) comp16694_c5_seq3:62-631(+)